MPKLSEVVRSVADAGLEGEDFLAGDPTLFGPGGDDSLAGGPGEDEVYGRGDDDSVAGGPGKDEISDDCERTVRGPHPDPWDARFGVTR